MFRLLLLFVTLHISYTLSLYSKWEWLSPQVQGNYLYDVKFINSDVGWAVGGSGSIIKSEDGGLLLIISRFDV